MVDPQKSANHEQVVVADYGGIVPLFEAFYLESLIYAAGRAVEAFTRYDRARQEDGNEAAIVANVHEALTHTAAVSRFFWPSRERGVTGARAQKLREAFELTEASPLYDRDLRNALEHFDERLDQFLLGDIVGYFFPGPMVGPSSLADEQLGRIFRLVDPEAREFVLLGRRYAFGPMRLTIEQVLSQANSMSSNGGRLRSRV